MILEIKDDHKHRAGKWWLEVASGKAIMAGRLTSRHRVSYFQVQGVLTSKHRGDDAGRDDTGLALTPLLGVMAARHRDAT